MADKITEIKIKLTIDGKETTAELKLTDEQIRKLHSSAQGLSDRMSKWGMIVTGFNQGLDILRKGWDLINAAVDIYEERQKAMLEIISTIESMGRQAEYSADELVRMADNLEKFNKYAVDANDIMSGESILIGFEKMNNETLPRATQLTIDLAKRMGTDIPNAAMTIGIALEQPAEGFRRLRSAGVVFDETERKIIEHLVETGDVAKAQEKIFDSLERKIGGFARNTTSYVEGVKNSVADMWQGVVESIGKSFEEGFLGFTMFLDQMLSAASGGLLSLGVLEQQYKDRQQYKEDSRQKMFKEIINKAAADALKASEKMNDAELKNAIANQKKIVNQLSKIQPDANNYDWQKNDYDKALAVQQKYEDVLEARKIISSDKSKKLAEQTAKDRENSENKLMEALKFENENYYAWKVAQINEEAKHFEALGLNKITIEKYVTEEIKKLDKEKAASYKATQEQLNALGDIKPLDIEVKGFTGLPQAQEDYDDLINARAGYYERIKFLDANYVAYRIGIINKETDLLKEKGLTEIEIERYKNAELKNLQDEYYQWKFEQYKKDHKLFTGIVDTMGGAYDNFFGSLTDTQMSGTERMNRFWQDLKGGFIALLADMIKQYAANLIMRAVIGETAQAAQIAAAIATGTAIASAYAPAAAFASIASFGAADIAGAAGLASTVALSYVLAVPKLEKGGLPDDKEKIIRMNEHEFIVNRDSTKHNLALLNEINENPGVDYKKQLASGFINRSTLHRQVIEAIQNVNLDYNKIYPKNDNGTIDEIRSLRNDLKELQGLKQLLKEAIERPVAIGDEQCRRIYDRGRSKSINSDL